MKKADVITICAPSSDVEPSRIVDGIIVKSAADPSNGSIMVDCVSKANVLTGFVDDRRRVFFFRGTVEKLQAWSKEIGLVPGADLSVALQPLRIVVKEQLTPFYTRANGVSQEPKINPKTGKVLLKGGSPIYRTTELTPADSDVVDILVQHDSESESGLAEFMAASQSAQMPA